VAGLAAGDPESGFRAVARPPFLEQGEQPGVGGRIDLREHDFPVVSADPGEAIAERRLVECRRQPSRGCVG
jgi:hypothetical protein